MADLVKERLTPFNLLDVKSGLEPAGPRQRHQCVLVIDDDARVIELLHSYLSGLGIKVHGAASVLGGLATLDEHLPGLVLLDVMMPGVDGVEVCGVLNRLPETHQVPVGIITALDPEDVADAATRAGASFILRKPLDFDELSELVNAVLKGRTPAKNKYRFKNGTALSRALGVSRWGQTTRTRERSA